MDFTQAQRDMVYQNPLAKAVSWNGNDTLKGIISHTGYSLNLHEGAIEGNTPCVRLVASDVPGIKQGDEIVIDGAFFYVLHVPEVFATATVLVELTADEVIA